MARFFAVFEQLELPPSLVLYAKSTSHHASPPQWQGGGGVELTSLTRTSCPNCNHIEIG